MTLHSLFVYAVLWVFSGYLGWFVGFMSSLTAPAPLVVDGLIPVRREWMG